MNSSQRGKSGARFLASAELALILCKASSNWWYKLFRQKQKPTKRRRPDEILHQTAQILLWNRPAHKKNVCMRAQ